MLVGHVLHEAGREADRSTCLQAGIGSALQLVDDSQAEKDLVAFVEVCVIWNASMLYDVRPASRRPASSIPGDVAHSDRA